MKTIALKGTPRTNISKTAVKALRRDKQVPCVLYGNNVENVHFSVNEADLKPLIYTPNAYIVNIDIDGKIYDAIMHNSQYHPVNDNVIHIDFYAVNTEKPLAMNIPVAISGNSEGVRAGGKLQVINRKIKVSALPKDLPDTLPIDITNLGLGKNIVAGDLSFDNVTIICPKSTIICAVKMTRAAASAAAPGTDDKK